MENSIRNMNVILGSLQKILNRIGILVILKPLIQDRIITVKVTFILSVSL